LNQRAAGAPGPRQRRGRSLARLACEPSSARLTLMYAACTLRVLRAVVAPDPVWDQLIARYDFEMGS